MIDAIILPVLTFLLKFLFSIYLMCEHEPVVLSLVIFLLTFIILLLAYLSIAKFFWCEKLTKEIQILRQTINFFQFI